MIINLSKPSQVSTARYLSFFLTFISPKGGPTFKDFLTRKMKTNKDYDKRQCIIHMRQKLALHTIIGVD